VPKYSISGVISADKHLGQIEAANVQEALAKAWDELDTSSPNICHHCSHEMNVGDVYRLTATNVDDDTDHAESDD
jgi:hypothetical protein